MIFMVGDGKVKDVTNPYVELVGWKKPWKTAKLRNLEVRVFEEVIYIVC